MKGLPPHFPILIKFDLKPPLPAAWVILELIISSKLHYSLLNSALHSCNFLLVSLLA
jgi:hypothetical protein